MRYRSDFVTNSSSSSFIVCFARIADKDKAQKILDKYNPKDENSDSIIEVYSAQDVLDNIESSRWHNWLECDWAGVDVTPSKDYIKKHMNDNFIVIEDYTDIEENDWGECYFDEENHDPEILAAIDEITQNNGFAEIDCDCGAGRNG